MLIRNNYDHKHVQSIKTIPKFQNLFNDNLYFVDSITFLKQKSSI